MTMIANALQIRRATVADIPAIIRLRRAMFEELGYVDEAALDAADAASRAYLHRALPLRRYRGWVAADAAGEVVAAGGLIFERHPPCPCNLGGRLAYVVGVGTDPARRDDLLAGRILARLLADARRAGVTAVTVHASERGREVYERLGFVPSNELRAVL
jgi:N-acetylglutamate synthase-like GNAT family acetyltransferase